MGKDKNPNIWIQRVVLKSEAFKTLSASAMSLYLHFLMKRQMTNVGRSGKKNWVMKNNGQIVFTYAMAKSELNMSASSFMRSLDKLIDHGLIDIVYSGSGGRKGDCSLYAISERWQKFRKTDFVEKPRPKDRRKVGFRHHPENIKRRVKK